MCVDPRRSLLIAGPGRACGSALQANDDEEEHSHGGKRQQRDVVAKENTSHLFDRHPSQYRHEVDKSGVVPGVDGRVHSECHKWPNMIADEAATTPRVKRSSGVRITNRTPTTPNAVTIASTMTKW